MTTSDVTVNCVHANIKCHFSKSLLNSVFMLFWLMQIITLAFSLIELWTFLTFTASALTMELSVDYITLAAAATLGRSLPA